MILDTSAIIAILRDEPEAARFAKAIEDAAHRRISAVNYVEAAAVIDGSRDPVASRRFDDLLHEARVIVEPVTEAQALMKREFPRLCRGGTRSLTDPGVHPRNSRREPRSTRKGETGWTSMKA